MKASQLRIGDRIRIVGVAGNGDPNYYIHRDTIRVYKNLMARNRSVRIRKIDEYGSPWFCCKFKRRDGTWEWHYLAVYDNDNNWVSVRKREK